MSSYKTDILFGKLITWLIPLNKPRPKLLALAMALCYGVVYVYATIFRNWSKGVEEHLAITPQVCVLQKYLNDKYDHVFKRIYIEDGIQYPEVYLYKRDEQKPKYARTRAENQPVLLGLRSESGYKQASFRVRIPADVKNKEAQITAFVQKYKLPSKTFEVIEI